MLLKHCHHRQDAEGKPVTLHTIRDKSDRVTDLIEVKLGDATPSAFPHRMSERLAPARATQTVADLRQPARHARVGVTGAAMWPGQLAA